MRINKFACVGLAFLIITGCASKPTGPKLFDNAVLVVKADSPITVPPDLPKEFVESIRARAAAIGQAEIARLGDLNKSEACGPRTMKITQDITAVSMSQNLTASRSFFGTVTQDTKQEISISTSMRIEDCQSGKLVYSYDYSITGNNPAQILQELISYNIYLAYGKQHQK